MSRNEESKEKHSSRRKGSIVIVTYLTCDSVLNIYKIFKVPIKNISPGVAKIQNRHSFIGVK